MPQLFYVQQWDGSNINNIINNIERNISNIITS